MHPDHVPVTGTLWLKKKLQTLWVAVIWFICDFKIDHPVNIHKYNSVTYDQST